MFTSSWFNSLYTATAFFLVCVGHYGFSQDRNPLPLAGTTILTGNADLASEMIDGVDRFLLRQIGDSPIQRAMEWRSAFAKEDIGPFITGKRNLLRNQIGLVDQRSPSSVFQIVKGLSKENEESGALATSTLSIAFQVEWNVFPGVDGSGIIVCPKDRSKIRFGAVVVPDASQGPEQLCGIGKDSDSVAFDLADRGGLVVIPQVLGRTREARNGRAVLTDQEYIYRSAFVLGRHVLGYHVQEVLAAIDAIKHESSSLPILVAGWGEGGWIALHASAIDERINVACVSGHFGEHEQIWREPIHRNVQSILLHFGDAQLACMIAPRSLIVDKVAGPVVEIGGDGGAPGTLTGPTPVSAEKEIEIANEILRLKEMQKNFHVITPASNRDQMCPSKDALSLGLRLLNKEASDNLTDQKIQVASAGNLYERSSKDRRLESVQKWDRFQQRVLESSAMERQWFWDLLKNATPDNYLQTVEPARNRFRSEVIGDWNRTLSQPNVRTRRIYDEAQWSGYEVVLDVFDEVFSYGVLLLPKDNQPLVQRPCVVFQHGLEGRPKDTIEGDHQAYHDVSVQLVKQGYVVFAPQNLYIFKDRFRTLQRKSNPMGRTLFSIMVPQHEQIVRWLGSRPEVDKSRIAFYGLSYGGKSAMRIPALVPGYCLSICSADFNEWVWKNASTTSNYSYVWTGEYEIFEFGLGRTFNYAEMAALIAPRPFMVERGHFDGVAPDERVAFEFAKVNRFYTTILKNPGGCEIEWFNGPHTINGQGTFRFLAKHLKL